MRKNVASQVISAQLISSTDGSAVTSGTTTVYVCGDGGTQTSGGTATHEGQGLWSFLPSQADTNYNHVTFTFVNSSAISTTVQVYPVGYDPTQANLLVDTVKISGDTTAADNLEAAADGTGYNLGNGSIVAASVTGAVGSVTGNVGGNVTGSVGSVTGNLGGNVVGSVASVTAGVTLAADSITSTALAASAVTEIQSGLSTLDAAGVRTALGMASANLDLQLGAIDDFLDTEIAAIKAKTDNLPSDPADASDVAAAFTIVNNTLSVLSSKIDTVDDFLDTEIAAIKTTTDRLETTWVLDGSVYQFTANALELAPSASGSGDWTATEKEQIRYRLGLDGTESAPASNTPSLGTVNAHVVSTATGVTLPDDTADTPTEINIYAGVDKTVILSVSVTSTWSKAIFTVKHNTTQIDSASVIQLVVSNPGDAADGLRYLLGSSATAAQGSLSVNHSTDQITVFLSAAATTQFTKSYTNLSWDVKVIYDDGTIPQLMSAGQCNVHRLPGRSLS